ncbi:hypothetical protein AMTR_s00058p00041080 [Amborella trichopoda]|uniref:Uncharacterized protein n=1 Tax=Amborella trichopoda TaxID=13333 RepID=W1PH98_AMBTC|nr:hypothetical protein AMTR_s00058p00041080 [Amborella trichopoda]
MGEVDSQRRIKFKHVFYRKKKSGRDIMPLDILIKYPSTSRKQSCTHQIRKGKKAQKQKMVEEIGSQNIRCLPDRKRKMILHGQLEYARRTSLENTYRQQNSMGRHSGVRRMELDQVT